MNYISHIVPCTRYEKTYGTTLIDSDVDEGFITEQMGHSDISTTKKLYYFSNKTTKNKEKQIENDYLILGIISCLTTYLTTLELFIEN